MHIIVSDWPQKYHNIIFDIINTAYWVLFIFDKYVPYEYTISGHFISIFVNALQTMLSSLIEHRTFSDIGISAFCTVVIFHIVRE